MRFDILGLLGRIFSTKNPLVSNVPKVWPVDEIPSVYVKVFGQTIALGHIFPGQDLWIYGYHYAAFFILLSLKADISSMNSEDSALLNQFAEHPEQYITPDGTTLRSDVLEALTKKANEED